MYVAKGENEASRTCKMFWCRKLLSPALFRRGGCQCTHGVRKLCTESRLVSQLSARIRMGGPLTVADYMREVLTNPTAGYYMHKDVFGEKGDFTTSPEISQMFGEMIAVWCVHEWQKCGSPEKLQVVELGPGRGTLADDMLRVFSQFDTVRDAISLHLVEVSPHLSQMQKEKLSSHEEEEGPADVVTRERCNSRCRSRFGQDVYWYKQLPDVPKGFSFYVAHEFFDALPVHKFQKKDGRWSEVLVDIDPGSVSDEQTTSLRYVLSPGETVGSKVLLSDAFGPRESREHIEVCPDGAVLIQEIANRVAIDGGFALIADYGHTGNKEDTFRAFKDHKVHDPLVDPGLADLTADVDFAYLSRMVQDRASVHGPIDQETFLYNMGIRYRLQVLLKNAGPEQRKSLISGFDMMCNPEKMGERFKFMALTRHRPGDDYHPAGFKELV